MIRKESLVSAVELVTHVHATEDHGKVVEALMKLIPSEDILEINVESNSYKGHFGNRIEILRIRVDDNLIAKRIISKILSMITDSDRQIIKASLRDRLSDSKLHIRINKQSLYLGKPYLDDGDDIVKIIIHLNTLVMKRMSIEELLTELEVK